MLSVVFLVLLNILEITTPNNTTPEVALDLL